MIYDAYQDSLSEMLELQQADWHEYVADATKLLFEAMHPQPQTIHIQNAVCKCQKGNKKCKSTQCKRFFGKKFANIQQVLNDCEFKKMDREIQREYIGKLVHPAVEKLVSNYEA
jgi:hypothetical protein